MNILFLENLEQAWNAIRLFLDKKLNKPEESGTPGQVLTMTEYGNEWKDVEIDHELEERVKTLEDVVDVREQKSHIVNLLNYQHDLNMSNNSVYEKNTDEEPQSVVKYVPEQTKYSALMIKPNVQATVNTPNGLVQSNEILIPVPTDFPDDYLFLYVDGSSDSYASSFIFGKEAKEKAVDGMLKYTTPPYFNYCYITVENKTINGSLNYNTINYLDVIKVELDEEKYSEKVRNLEKLLEIKVQNDVPVYPDKLTGATINNYLYKAGQTTSESVDGFVVLNIYVAQLPGNFDGTNNYVYPGSVLRIPIDESYPDGYDFISQYGCGDMVTMEQAKRDAVDGYYHYKLPFFNNGNWYGIVVKANAGETSITDAKNYIGVIREDRYYTLIGDVFSKLNSRINDISAKTIYNLKDGSPSYYGSIESTNSKAEGRYNFSFGSGNTTSNSGTTAFGVGNSVSGNCSFAAGSGNTTSNNGATAFGVGNTASGNYSHAEGYFTSAVTSCSHAEGRGTTANGSSSHAEGQGTIASGNYSHAEGSNTTASGSTAHAEGYYTSALTPNSHAEGSNTTASGDIAHAEGRFTTANGAYSHAEGSNTTASGMSSHAEGWFTTANGAYSHAEGQETTASSACSHSEGFITSAIGAYSHTEGNGTTASNNYEHAEGRWNLSNKKSDDFGNSGNTISSIGVGSSINNKKNAFEVMQNGDHYIYGIGGYDGTNPEEAKTLQEVINSVGAVGSGLPEDGEIGQVLTKTDDGVEWQNPKTPLRGNYIQEIKQNGGSIEYKSTNFQNGNFDELKIDFKTINGQSVFGMGDIKIEGGGSSLPTGGQTGQVLTKTDNGAEWKSLPSNDGITMKRIERDDYDAMFKAGTLDDNTLYLITG